MRVESQRSQADKEQKQRTRLRCLHGRYINLVLAVVYIPEIPIIPKTGTVRELPRQSVVVHYVECLAERVETVQQSYVKEGA